MRQVTGRPVEADQLERATIAWLRIGAPEPISMAERYREWRAKKTDHISFQSFK